MGLHPKLPILHIPYNGGYRVYHCRFLGTDTQPTCYDRESSPFGIVGGPDEHQKLTNTDNPTALKTC